MLPEEEAFQKQLDEAPDVWTVRLVFADWLEEQGDSRAEGYRALGIYKLYPYLPPQQNEPWSYANFLVKDTFKEDNSKLPDDWFEELRGFYDRGPISYVPFKTRREADNGCALAFAELPPERKAQLLTQRVLS